MLSECLQLSLVSSPCLKQNLNEAGSFERVRMRLVWPGNGRMVEKGIVQQKKENGE